jgi:hypothetical protein
VVAFGGQAPCNPQFSGKERGIPLVERSRPPLAVARNRARRALEPIPSNRTQPIRSVLRQVSAMPGLPCPRWLHLPPTTSDMSLGAEGPVVASAACGDLVLEAPSGYWPTTPPRSQGSSVGGSRFEPMVAPALKPRFPPGRWRATSPSAAPTNSSYTQWPTTRRKVEEPVGRSD